MAKIEPGMESMLDMYFYETNSLLEQLDEILLRTEQANSFDSEDIKEIFRIMHTIKGSSAMMGFENLSVLAHKAEDMFFVIRENPDVITDVSFVYDLVFQVSDSYKAQIELIQNNVNGEFEQLDFSELIDKLLKARDALVGETKGETPAQAEAIAAGTAPDPEAAPAQAAAPAPAASKDNKTTVRVFFEDGCQMENLRAFLLINTIKDACQELEFTPADVETNPETAKEIVEKGFLITFVPHDSVDEVLKAIESALNVQSYEIVSQPAPAAPAAEPAKTELPPEPKAAAPAAPAPAAPAPAPAAAPVHKEPTAVEKAQAAVDKAQAAGGVWENVIGLTVCGCRKEMRYDHRARGPSSGAPYFRSPYSGSPREENCARIWCVRPVSSRIRTRLFPSACASTR